MAGWIKLHREIKDHWIYTDASRLKAWINMLIEVNFEDKKVFIHGELFECKRGQSLYSLSTWADKLGRGWTVQKIRTFFNLLEKDEMIVIEGLRKTTRLTICNYELYQDSQQTNNKQITDKQQADNKQITTTKEGKERKEGKEGKEINIVFDDFWNLYDYKKGDKEKLKHKWNKLKDKEREDIIAYIPKYITSTPDKQYRKHPDTFLNNRSWEDEIINKSRLLTINENPYEGK